MVTVTKRIVRGDVTIEGDHQQTLEEELASSSEGNNSPYPNRGSGTENVDRQPKLAEKLAEVPNAEGGIGSGEGKNSDAQQKVTDREVDDQIVGHAALTNRFVENEGQNDQNVTENRPNGDREENDTQNERNPSGGRRRRSELRDVVKWLVEGRGEKHRLIVAEHQKQVVVLVMITDRSTAADGRGEDVRITVIARRLSSLILLDPSRRSTRWARDEVLLHQQQHRSKGRRRRRRAEHFFQSHLK